jgi:oxygen-independent coproporphyrinogen-3 oxidase
MLVNVIKYYIHDNRLMSCSLRQNILQFDRAVPRYTSYPTAPNFKPVETTRNFYGDITEADSLSLYIHIPFCPKMCWYCGCHTKITKQYDPVADYVSYLLKEIDLVASHHNQKLTVSHIHFGGGSPGMLSAYDFEKIMTGISMQFEILPQAEIAIEIDPRGVTADRIKAYAKYGVNRVSLGCQDFNDDVLESVNREQPYKLSYDAVKLFREHGIDNINLDLIYGLPHQTIENMNRTIDLALTLNPQRIALFGYAHVPWMKKHMRLIDDNALPDKELRFDLFATGAKKLEENGYESVGIDHFVRPEDAMAKAAKNKTLKRNFQGYTTDQSNIMIGLGISSIGKTGKYYIQNTSDMPIYKKKIESGELPIMKSCSITQEDKIRGEIIERIMCDFEIDLSKYAGDYSDILFSLNQYADRGLIQIKDRVVKINKEARPIARLVCAAFDQYLRSDMTQKHSKAV